MCLVWPAWGCKSFSVSPRGGLSHLQFDTYLWFPFTIFCHLSAPCFHAFKTLDHMISKIPLTWSDPGVFSPYTLDSRQDFWWEKRILWIDSVSFWQKHHPSNQRGVKNYKSLVILTQRGQSLTKDSLSLLNLTRRQPPSKIKRTNPFRLWNESPLEAKSHPFGETPASHMQKAATPCFLGWRRPSGSNLKLSAGRSDVGCRYWPRMKQWLCML